MGVSAGEDTRWRVSRLTPRMTTQPITGECCCVLAVSPGTSHGRLPSLHGLPPPHQPLGLAQQSTHGDLYDPQHTLRRPTNPFGRCRFAAEFVNAVLEGVYKLSCECPSTRLCCTAGAPRARTHFFVGAPKNEIRCGPNLWISTGINL